MTITTRFMEYAAAFEEAFESDEWSKVGTFFTDDGVYATVGPPPFGTRAEGRAAVLAGFKQALDAFDRRFDKREVSVLEGPIERDPRTLWFKWLGIYRRAGLPDLRMEGEETAVFEGQHIKHLEDRFTPATAERIAGYVAAHGATLATPP